MRKGYIQGQEQDKKRAKSSKEEVGSIEMNIKEIAKLAGVSVATVSRVLNDSPKIRPDTRERVLEIIQAHGYVPNKVARSLSRKKSNNIAVIIPDIGNEYFAELILGMASVVEQNNYNMLFFNTDESDTKEHNALNVVGGELISGLIVCPVSAKDRWTAEKLHAFQDKQEVPVVLVDRKLDGEDFNCVLVDNHQGAFEATEALIAAGHRRIAIVTGPESSLPGQGRKEGFLDALGKHGIEIPDSYVVSGDFRADRAYAAVGELMALAEPPTAIFTSNNETSLGFMRYITEHKLKLGRDISAIGFDGINSFKLINFPFSTVERDVALQGEMAASLLMQILLEPKQHKEYGVRLSVNHKLVLRGSEHYAWS